MLEPVLHAGRLELRATRAGGAAPRSSATAPPQPYTGLGAGLFTAAARARLRLLAGDSVAASTAAFSAPAMLPAHDAAAQGTRALLRRIFASPGSGAVGLAIGAPRESPLLHVELPSAGSRLDDVLAADAPDVDMQAARLPHGLPPMMRVLARPSCVEDWVTCARAFFAET